MFENIDPQILEAKKAVNEQEIDQADKIKEKFNNLEQKRQQAYKNFDLEFLLQTKKEFEDLKQELNTFEKQNNNLQNTTNNSQNITNNSQITLEVARQKLEKELLTNYLSTLNYEQATNFLNSQINMNSDLKQEFLSKLGAN